MSLWTLWLLTPHFLRLLQLQSGPYFYYYFFLHFTLKLLVFHTTTVWTTISPSLCSAQFFASQLPSTGLPHEQQSASICFITLKPEASEKCMCSKRHVQCEFFVSLEGCPFELSLLRHHPFPHWRTKTQKVNTYECIFFICPPDYSLNFPLGCITHLPH